VTARLRGSDRGMLWGKSTESDPVIASYFKEVGREEIIDATKERELFVLYKDNGDIKARDRIIGSALRFVVKLAKSYARDPSTTKDLISAGNVGLLVALDRYELKHNTRFLSYATSWVLLEMRNALYNSGVVSMPLWRQKILGRMKQVDAQSRARRGRKANLQELAQEVDLSTSQLQRLRECQEVCIIALETPDDMPASPSNRNSIDMMAMRQQTRTLLKLLIRELPSVKEQFVIRAYFGLVADPMSLRQIAGVLGVSSERIRQLKVDALKRLEKQLRFRLQLECTNDFSV